MKHILEEAFAYLINKKSYYAYILGNCRVVINAKRVPTAGVTVQKNRVTLVINPHFWKWLGDTQGVSKQAAVLEHEMRHVLHGHIFRSKHLKNSPDSSGNIISHSGINKAMDCSINQYEAQNLPTIALLFNEDGSPVLDDNGDQKISECVTYNNFKTGLEQHGIDTEELEEKREFEHYYRFLKDNQDKLPQDGAGSEFGETIDDHSTMDEAEGTEEEIRDVCRNTIKNALDSAKRAGVKDLHEIENVINTIYKSEINWKMILSRFISNSAETLEELTRRRPNRNYGLAFPGSRTTPKLKLDIFIDTSGSVGKEEKEAFFNQINSIIDDDYEVTLICGDSNITSIQKYNRKNAEIDFVGGGGTSYKPFFDLAKERKTDAMIILGDGYCFDTNELERPKIPVLWAITENGHYPVEWGTKLTISLNER